MEQLESNKEETYNTYSNRKQHESDVFHHPFLERHWLTEEEWKLLDNYRKEKIQLGVIYWWLWNLIIQHKSLKLFARFRPLEGDTIDNDILIFKDGKAKDQIELSHFGRKSWRNVEHRLQPTTRALYTSNTPIAPDFDRHYIQNGGICNNYLIEGCKEWGWNLHHCPHRIHEMTRHERRQLFKLLKRVVSHALREPRTHPKEEHVYAQDYDNQYFNNHPSNPISTLTNLPFPFLLLDRPPPNCRSSSFSGCRLPAVSRKPCSSNKQPKRGTVETESKARAYLYAKFANIL